MLRVSVLGSTGSIGSSTLEVIQNNIDKFSIFLLSAKSNNKKILEQCQKFRPAYAHLENKESAKILKEELSKMGINTKVVWEEEKCLELISDSSVDIVVAGVVGIAGLKSVYHAINYGKRVLLANKEAYIVAGELLNLLALEKGALIFPIDSEHSAIHQCISRSDNIHKDVSKLILTGSGGPFLKTDIKMLYKITPQQAISHPIWKMGKKISVDSATLMNKGLEIIEARWLFDLTSEHIELVIHPEGIVHSLVEFKYKSTIAQFSVPDMKIPIAYGLGFPNRINSGADDLNLPNLKSLTFLEPDLKKFPCLGLAKEALNLGGTGLAMLNAVNEEAVSAFLDYKISFIQIPEIISEIMDRIHINPVKDLEAVYSADKRARKLAKSHMESLWNR